MDMPWSDIMTERIGSVMKEKEKQYFSSSYLFIIGIDLLGHLCIWIFSTN